MAVSVEYREGMRIDLAWNELTGAIGDSVTVLPIVVAIAVLTELSLAMMLIWFGVFQIVWGLIYGVPISVEPMKALAALVIAGTITTGEFLMAGLLLGVVLLGLGVGGWLGRLEHFIGSPVVRGIQFGVALVLLEAGVRLGVGDPALAVIAIGVAVVVIALGRWNMSAIVVLLVGGGFAVANGGFPAPALPTSWGLAPIDPASFSLPTIEAAIAQLAMTVGNAALATSVLLADYFDRDVPVDRLSTSMGLMNLVSVPFGAIPMCHGSGGVAGKYAFGARTTGANVILGVGYVLIAIIGVGIVMAYPLAMLGVILALIALQLGRTSLRRADQLPLVVAIGLIGLLVNLGAALVVGMVLDLARRRLLG